MQRISTEDLIASLAPGAPDCLKTRANGTTIDGHHGIHALHERGVNVTVLPCEIIEKEEL
jgi:hypothetical protein